MNRLASGYWSTRIKAGAIGLAAATLAGFMAGGPAAVPNATPMSFADVVIQELPVNNAEVFALPIDGQPGDALFLPVPIDGGQAFLDLYPHSVRSRDYQVLVQNEHGEYEEVEPGVERTLRGDVMGVPFSSVAASLEEDGLYAHIVMPNGDDFWVEPLGDRFPDADPQWHMIYRGGDANCPDGGCGTDDLPFGGFGRRPLLAMGDGGGAGGDGGEICTAQLACDADVEMFTRWGTVGGTENRINTIVNTVNQQYENEVGITHEITTIIVRTSEPDPYTTSDAGSLLNQFRNHWLNNHQNITRDVAQLFTGRNLNGGTLGIAWIEGVCNSFGYSLVESNFTSNFACVTDLTAHELGHNWGAGHCNCPSHTMNPGLTCSNTFNASVTRPVIAAYRDAINCLDCNSGNPDEAVLQSYDIQEGSWGGGTVSSVVFSDDAYLNVFSAPSSNNKDRTRTEFSFDSPRLTTSGITTSIEAHGDVAGVEIIFAIYNFNRSKWVRLRKYTLPTTDSIKINTKSVANRFISDTGEILVRIKTVATNQPHQVSVDHISITVDP